MTKRFGFNLLADQIMDEVAQSVGWRLTYAEDSKSEGDSPIERLFFNALFLSLRYCDQEWFQGIFTVKANDDDWLTSMKDDRQARTHLIMQRQQQLPNWRVDFLFHVYADWARCPDGGTEGWKQLIVECDGHDFHERTKEQAARDRERDRWAQLQGIEVFRFTGSELWKDPLGCANQVIKWANRRV
jgi:hypothetical protein